MAGSQGQGTGDTRGQHLFLAEFQMHSLRASQRFPEGSSEEESPARLSSLIYQENLLLWLEEGLSCRKCL